MFDTKSLIFSLGLINLGIALVIGLYSASSKVKNLAITNLLRAKIAIGSGTLLGTFKAFFPPGDFFYVIGIIGNLLQSSGLGLELISLCYLAHRPNLIAPLARIIAILVGFQLLLQIFSLQGHAYTLTTNDFRLGTAILCYGSAAWVMLSCKPREKLDLMIACTSIILCLSITPRLVMTLWGISHPAFYNNLLNFVMYGNLIVMTIINGCAVIFICMLRSEALLKNALQQIQTQELEQEELLVTAAHEFRTPAAHIQALSDSVTKLQSMVPKEIHGRIVNIAAAAKRLTDLANNLISADRLKQKAMVPQLQRVNLDKMLKSIVAYYPDQERIVSRSSPGQNYIAICDPSLIRISLHNLIDNAIHHSSDKTSIEIDLSIMDGQAVFVVTNNHGGIPTEIIGRIFEKGSSASKNLKSGLGLHITKLIVEAHYGNITVQNLENGVRFRLTFPVPTKIKHLPD